MEAEYQRGLIEGKRLGTEAERERCATVCFDHGEQCENPSVAYVHGCQMCAAQIRKAPSDG